MLTAGPLVQRESPLLDAATVDPGIVLHPISLKALSGIFTIFDNAGLTLPPPPASYVFILLTPERWEAESTLSWTPDSVGIELGF